jgi:4-diphosphocytidyl-2-C-methyl-D-erythritol kinase
VKLELDSPAKINLWLRILGRRDDGFHEVQTRLCKVAVADTVALECCGRGEGVDFTCSEPGLPLDGSNLALRALAAFEQRAGVRHAWQLHLEKRIPAGAGLGGGSGNAATVLHAANELAGRPLALSDLLELAAGIGADVPFFLLDTAAADGTGRGEKVVPVELGQPFSLVLIKPPFPVPTPWAYRQWLGSQELPGVRYSAQSGPWGDLENSLERPVFEKYRLLPALKTWLLEQTGVLAALMSGSGSTLFAITRDEAAGQEVATAARAWLGESAWIQVTRSWEKS